MKFTHTLPNWRFFLFISLIVAAPLSKYPSISVPLFDFPSFRIGLYQILAVLFVISCLKPLYTAGIAFFARQHRYAFIALVVLAILSLASIAWSLYPARSALLGFSVALLVALVLSAWWYVATELTAARWQIVLQSMLYAAIFFGFVSFFQLAIFSLTDQTLGVLCPGCSADIFGFPRINGLAAEPQFFANAMLPFTFAAFYAVLKLRSRLAWLAFIASTITIGLTFSRGAYFALAIALLVTATTLIYKRFLSIKTFALVAAVWLVAIVASLALLTASATLRYSSTPNITYETIDSIFEHLTLGVINLPEKTAVVVQAPPSTSQTIATETTDNFVSPGLIESSGNERLGAAELAINAWQYNPLTAIFGVGIGNLGPFVVQNIDAAAPENLTVYVYYVLVLSELGVIGLSMLCLLFGAAITRLVRQNTLSAICIAGGLVAFAIQFLFFGSYINVIFIWLWLGIALGITTVTKKKQTRVKKV